jgi:hypothetical protein
MYVFSEIVTEFLKTLSIKDIPLISISGLFFNLVEPILAGIRIAKLLFI